MEFHFEIKDEKLRKLVEKKAEELGISVGELIWRYVNRGLMSDSINEDVFRKNHSEEFLREVDEALGLD